MKTRPIEMGVSFVDGQWESYVVQIPANTPNVKLEEVGGEAVIKHLHDSCRDIASTWIYNTMEDWEDDVDKTRPIEMAVAFGDGTWKAGFMVEIPDDTPEDTIHFTAMAVIMDRGGLHDVAHVWVHSTMEDSRPE